MEAYTYDHQDILTKGSSGDASRSDFLTKAPLTSKSPNLSYRISHGADGVLNGFIVNDLESDSCFGSAVLDVIDKSLGCPHGGYITVVHDPCGKKQVYHLPCNSRWRAKCSCCSKRWVRRYQRIFMDMLLQMKNPRLVTLTLKKWADVPRCDRIKVIRQLANQLFHYLRQRGYYIGSWFSVVEFPNHLHIVMDSDYIPQDLLSKLWRTVTGDSYIVDVRKIDMVQRAGPAGTVRYVTKYLTKSVSEGVSSMWSEKELKRFHIVQTHGYKRPKRRPRKCECGQIGPWYKVNYQRSLDSWRNSWGYTDKGPPVGPAAAQGNLG